MRIHLGWSDHYRKKVTPAQDVPVFWDSSALINPHLLICGKSGSGKTYQLRRLVGELASSGIRVHVFDVHGDIHVPGESRVVFSTANTWGFNPLVLNPDPHAGGVRRAIGNFLALLGRTSRRMGDRQEAVLRALLGDVFWLNGCREDDPRTWRKREITDTERAALVQQRQWSTLKQYYPTLEDLVQYTERKVRALFFGASGTDGNRCIAALEEAERAAWQLHGVQKRTARSDDDAEALQEKLEKAKAKAIAAYTDYVQAIETGRELGDLLKYDSKEVLRGVQDRLKNLQASGIFSATPPPFDPDAPVWVYDLHYLPPDEQLLLVCMRAESVFRERVQAGEQADVREVLVVDEAHKFLGDDNNDIFRRIVLEARKFGLGLWCSSQAPTHFSDDFLATVACKILLCIDHLYWTTSCRKLGIGVAVLRYLTPHQIAAVHLDHAGFTRQPFVGVQLTDDGG